MINLALTTLAVSLLALPSGAATPETCGPCARIETIKARMAKIKPDAIDAATGPQQDKLVVDAIDMVEDTIRVGQGKLSDADIERFVSFLALVLPYDPSNNIGGELLPKLRGQLDPIRNEIRRQKRAGLMSSETANDLEMAFINAEAERTQGNDDETEETSSAKPAADAPQVGKSSKEPPKK